MHSSVTCGAIWPEALEHAGSDRNVRVVIITGRAVRFVRVVT
jgi:hypothetical protein